jgi:hypothetical protein
VRGDIPGAARLVARALPAFWLGESSRFARLVRFDPDVIQLFFHGEEIVGLYPMLCREEQLEIRDVYL